MSLQKSVHLYQLSLWSSTRLTSQSSGMRCWVIPVVFSGVSKEQKFLHLQIKGPWRNISVCL